MIGTWEIVCLGFTMRSLRDFGATLLFFYSIFNLWLNFFMGYFQELWKNRPNIFIGGGFAILVLLGIYIKLLNIYK